MQGVSMLPSQAINDKPGCKNQVKDLPLHLLSNQQWEGRVDCSSERTFELSRGANKQAVDSERYRYMIKADLY